MTSSNMFHSRPSRSTICSGLSSWTQLSLTLWRMYDEVRQNGLRAVLDSARRRTTRSRRYRRSKPMLRGTTRASEVLPLSNCPPQIYTHTHSHTHITVMYTACNCTTLLSETDKSIGWIGWMLFFRKAKRRAGLCYSDV